MPSISAAIVRARASPLQVPSDGGFHARMSSSYGYTTIYGTLSAFQPAEEDWKTYRQRLDFYLH